MGLQCIMLVGDANPTYYRYLKNSFLCCRLFKMYLADLTLMNTKWPICKSSRFWFLYDITLYLLPAMMVVHFFMYAFYLTAITIHGSNSFIYFCCRLAVCSTKSLKKSIPWTENCLLLTTSFVFREQEE